MRFSISFVWNIIMKILSKMLLTAVLLLSAGLLFAAPKTNEKPDWVSGWRTMYPDETYIAQLGKAVGKNAADEAKNNAANAVAQYVQTTVQSEVQSNTVFTTETRANGTMGTSTKKTNSQDIKLSVDLTLSSLEFTEPWYNKKEKAWYCVAYVSREKTWEQYRPNLQAARDKLFAFYKAAENTSEPLYRIRYYAQSHDYEQAFYEAFSFSRLFSVPLTEQHYGADALFVSGVQALSAEEKSRCTFAIEVSDDVQSFVYQKLKDCLSSGGYTVKNKGEEAEYTVNAALILSDSPAGDLHVISPSLELSVNGKTATVFSYAKTAANFHGLKEDIVKAKAAKAIADEIGKSFMQEFTDTLGKDADDALSQLLAL